MQWLDSIAYQDDFVTPGSCPTRASWRKQIRHIPNLRMNALGRPQSRQRLCCCTRNFGGRWDFTILDTFAKLDLRNE